ncbi:MAG: hypothetical protein ABSH20_05625 [Tepidisphaeraceae bacterium]
MASKKRNVEGTIPFPPPYRRIDEPVDVTGEFAEITRRTPHDPIFKWAFRESRIRVVSTHSSLSPALQRKHAARLREIMAVEPTPAVAAPPVPGGVGYGMFYDDPPFQDNWTTGTLIYFEPICPTPPGGNINTYFYITASNRSAQGVEALVSYNGQNQTYFKIYDWARSTNDHWQTNVSFGDLDPKYFIPKQPAHGKTYRVLPIQNVTYCVSGSTWRNRVYLFDQTAGQPNLVYEYDYTASLATQQNAWPGSWGPIVETFQPSYSGTKTFGSLNTKLMGRNGGWTPWHLLLQTDSYLRQDNKGFDEVFMDQNHSWGVNS